FESREQNSPAYAGLDSVVGMAGLPFSRRLPGSSLRAAPLPRPTSCLAPLDFSGPAFGVRVPRTKQPSLRWARFSCRDGGTPLLSSPSWLLAAGRPSASPNFLFGAPRFPRGRHSGFESREQNSPAYAGLDSVVGMAGLEPAASSS